MLTQNASKNRVIQTTSLESRASANSPSLFLCFSFNFTSNFLFFSLHVQINYRMQFPTRENQRHSSTAYKLVLVHIKKTEHSFMSKYKSEME